MLKPLSVETPFWDMYIHKTDPTPPQNTPFPGLNLKVGKMNYSLSKMDPSPQLGKMFEKRTKISRSGQLKFIHNPVALWKISQSSG